VFLAVAGAVTQPIEGAREAGVAGCFRGLGLGLCTGLFFAITGLCTGVFQAVRGVAATPRAICMASKGWHWDATSSSWEEPKVYSLPEEAEQVFPLGRGSTSSPSRRRVADSHYYDQLEVAPSATQLEIRKAYFQRSRQCHPDKTSEQGATERFQGISEAYQVLSDPERRRKYDAQGRQDSSGEGFVDGKVFFSVLLGADALEPYIGRLRLSEMFGEDLFGGAGDGEGGLAQQLRSLDSGDHRQVRRQVRLAVRLTNQLQARTAGGADGDAVVVRARAEARGILQKDPSLERFVMEIGWVYMNRAQWYLARTESRFGSYGLRAIRLRMRRRGREASMTASTAKLALRSLMNLRRIVSEADSSAAAQGDAPRASGEDEMPQALTNALSLTAHDITGTLSRVIERVLSDASVDAAARRARAEALFELGSVLAEEARVCYFPVLGCLKHHLFVEFMLLFVLFTMGK
ncbi:unnamed protein product, partial [Polarella glacialis]